MRNELSGPLRTRRTPSVVDGEGVCAKTCRRIHALGLLLVPGASPVSVVLASVILLCSPLSGLLPFGRSPSTEQLVEIVVNLRDDVFFDMDALDGVLESSHGFARAKIRHEALMYLLHRVDEG